MCGVGSRAAAIIEGFRLDSDGLEAAWEGEGEGRSVLRIEEGARSPGVGASGKAAGGRLSRSGDDGSRILVSFFRPPQMRSSRLRRWRREGCRKGRIGEGGCNGLRRPGYHSADHAYLVIKLHLPEEARRLVGVDRLMLNIN